MAVWILREFVDFEIDRVSGTALAAGLKPVDCHREKPAASALPLKDWEVPESLATHEFFAPSASDDNAAVTA